MTIQTTFKPHTGGATKKRDQRERTADDRSADFSSINLINICFHDRVCAECVSPSRTPIPPVVTASCKAARRSLPAFGLTLKVCFKEMRSNRHAVLVESSDSIGCSGFR